MSDSLTRFELCVNVPTQPNGSPDLERWLMVVVQVASTCCQVGEPGVSNCSRYLPPRHHGRPTDENSVWISGSTTLKDTL